MKYLSRTAIVMLEQLDLGLSTGAVGEGPDAYTLCRVMRGDTLLIEARSGYGDEQTAVNDAVEIALAAPVEDLLQRRVSILHTRPNGKPFATVSVNGEPRTGCGGATAVSAARSAVEAAIGPLGEPSAAPVVKSLPDTRREGALWRAITQFATIAPNESPSTSSAQIIGEAVRPGSWLGRTRDEVNAAVVVVREWIGVRRDLIAANLSPDDRATLDPVEGKAPWVFALSREAA